MALMAEILLFFCCSLLPLLYYTVFFFGSQVKTPDLLIGWVGHSLQVAEDGSQVTNSIRRKGGNNDFSKFAKKIPG